MHIPLYVIAALAYEKAAIGIAEYDLKGQQRIARPARIAQNF